jgi:hypothetical protein
VRVDTGVVYLSPGPTEALWQLLEQEPFTACTLRGVSAGQPPLRLELYSDMMCALK